MRTFACHCTFCQRMTGTSFYAESLFPMDAVQFNNGELRQYAHRSDGSHKNVFVHFCPSCGTTMAPEPSRRPGFDHPPLAAFQNAFAAFPKSSPSR
jgi:hypothetical protein